ncbi:MAG: hypothetical protein BIFFINMI_00218 [Phycisphaerae bacterium]|nr:hypothetical protein [Phycisphaerae bacterium]
MLRLTRALAAGIIATTMLANGGCQSAQASGPRASAEPTATQPDNSARLGVQEDPYVTRAGAFYVDEYVPSAADSLVRQAANTRLTVPAARELLVKLCYDYLRVYVANAMDMPYSENVRLLKQLDHEVLTIVDDREAFARYCLWRDGPNALAFLMRPRHRLELTPPPGWTVTYLDTPEKLKPFQDLFAHPPVELALLTRTVSPIGARLPSDGPFLCLLAFNARGSRQLAEQYDKSYAIVTDGRSGTRYDLLWQTYAGKYVIFAAEGDEPAAQAELRRAVLRQFLYDTTAP